MSNFTYHQATSEWQHNALQLATTGQWEEALTLWSEQATPDKLNLWLLKRLDGVKNASNTQLLGEMQRWITEPEEKLRWKIFHHAEKLGFDTPVGALALSLFWSQGSMSPEGLEPVYPEPHLSGLMRRCVLLMLATLNNDSPAKGTTALLAQWAHQENL